MKRRHVLAASLLTVAAALPASAPLAESEATWNALINGTTGLEHWTRVGDANWRAEDGAIVADAGRGGYLVSRGSYGDFDLEAEFWADHSTNSGIFIRVSNRAQINSRSAYEVNIFDQSKKAGFGTGAIVNVAPVSAMPKVGGKWSTIAIKARGPRLTVLVDGARTVDIADDRFGQGPIALQYRKGPIKWRSVKLRER